MPVPTRLVSSEAHRNDPSPADGTRFILYHKHKDSARTRFLRFGHGGVCGPKPLSSAARPEAARASEDQGTADGGAVLAHPAMSLRATEHLLALPRGSLEIDTGFRFRLAADGEPVEVRLARFTGIDPPFGAAEACGGCFVTLLQARDLPGPELHLLRLAYDHVLS
jgi:hypothetical protein